MNQQQNLKRGYKEKDAADYIAMSISFLRQSRMKGELEGRIPAPPFIKVGKLAIRYLREDLDSWCDQFKKYTHTHQS